MKAFEWANPTTIDEAVKLLNDQTAIDIDEAPRPIAGGQDLLTTMKEYSSQPSRVVNLKSIRGLNKLSLDAKGLTIGALITLTELEEHQPARKNIPGLVEAAHSIATPQIRNLGTVAGNLCQRPRCWYFRLEEVTCLKKGGDTCYSFSGENKYNAILGGGPSYIVHPSDLAPMLVALGAQLNVTGSQGKRVIPLDKFFTLPSEGNLRRENVLKNDDIITEIFVPASPLTARSTYLKFKERDSLDFAMSAVAVALQMNGKTVKDVRIVLGGVAPIPWRVPDAEKFVIGKELTNDVLQEAGKIALARAEPLQNNAYKIPLTQTLVRRALAKAAGINL
ncbi:MAG TPA: xanthine dehydrogenase family protein subunit M [Pyrinomonadaceae bacterium]|jgi:xanthine dehydrogenase YagS FAD-binding subunit|nr:xanthine dehydrogenase family protein subunit M [Pyrinomonadaceae bacterium]